MGGQALVARVGAGDVDAFGELYREYADRVFSLCVVLLRDRDEAADAMHDVFITAWQRIGQLRDPERITAWLYAIARHTCYRRTKQRNRPVADIDLTIDVDDDTDGLSPADASALVSAAAAGLNERDRTLLFLHLNEGLDGEDLAAAAGLPTANPYSPLSRAKQQLAAAIDALAVARLSTCNQLGDILHGWDRALTPLWRKRIHRHTEHCDLCNTTRQHARRTPALTTAAVLATSTCAQALTAPELVDIASRRPAPTEQWQPDGFPPTEPDKKRRRRIALLLFIAALGVLLLIALLGDDQPTHRTGGAPAQPAATIISVLPATTTPGTATTTTTTPPRTATTNPQTRTTTPNGTPTAVITPANQPPATTHPSPPTTKPVPPTTAGYTSTTQPG